MARLFTSGAESNDATVEGVTVTNVTFDSAAPLSGAFSYKHDTTSTNNVGNITLTGMGSSSADRWLRARFKINSFPAASTFLRLVYSSTSTTGFSVRLNVSGIGTAATLGLYNQSTSAQIGSDSVATIIEGQSFLVELYFNHGSGTGNAELRLDGVTVATATGASIGATATNPAVGQVSSPGLAVVTYVDDIAVNDGTAGTGQTSWPGEGKVVMLTPASDNSVGTGWTLSTGTAISSNGWDSVNNEPPQGVADLTALSDAKQIRNATSNANVDYKANTGTYLAAGLGASDTVTLCQAVVATAAPSATSPKSGNLGATNPTIALATIGTFYQGTNIAGTYASGWKVTRSAIAYAPAPTLGSAAVLDVQQVTASTRIAMVCFMGMLVEYVPAAAVIPPGLGPVIGMSQPFISDMSLMR